MFRHLFPNLATLLSFVVLVTSFGLIVGANLTAQVRAFVFHSSTLAVLAAVVALFARSAELLLVALGLALIKCIIIPMVLRRAVTKIGIQRAVSPQLNTPAALAVCALLVVVSFYVMAPVTESNLLPTARAIPLGFSAVLIGFFVTVIRRRAITQILGFLMLENGIFLLALLATYGVPFIVEMGVFLDVLVAVLILEVFIYRIKENFDSIEVGELGELKG